MTMKIGFTVDRNKDNKEGYLEDCGGIAYKAPRRSVVEVFFSARNATYTYYNDMFDLACGDLVYVEGKLEGLQGRVVGVNYNFKIKVSDYKKVIAVVDTDVRGQFFMAGSHFVTFDRGVLPSEMALLWFKAPSLDDDDYVSGYDDTAFPLDDLNGLNISPVICERGHKYYVENRVRYISIDGDKGYAIVEGGHTYEVDFVFRGGEISGLTCSCFCGFNCKHEFATLLQLRETLDLIDKHYSAEYEHSGYFAAITKEALFNFAIDGKEKGDFVL